MTILDMDFLPRGCHHPHPYLPLALTEHDLLHPDQQTMATLWKAWVFEPVEAERNASAEALSCSIDALEEKMRGAKNDETTLRAGRQLLCAMYAQQGRARQVLFALVLLRFTREARGGSVETDVQELWRLIKRREACEVVSVQEAVRRAGVMKEEGNRYVKNGEWVDGLRSYALGLLELCPWSTDESIMDFEFATATGLGPIEEKLYLNIALAALRVPKEKNQVDLVPMAAEALHFLNFLPFLTVGSLLKRTTRMQELVERMPELLENRDVRMDLRDDQAAAKVWRTEPADRWAHAGCVGVHTCRHDIGEQLRSSKKVLTRRFHNTPRFSI